MRILLLTAMLCGVAFSQTPLTCSLLAGLPPSVRASGKTELVGDLTIFCTGGTPTAAGAAVPLYALTIQAQSITFPAGYYYINNPGGVKFNSINITSRQLASDGSSEALLLIDEPHSLTNPTVPLLVCGDVAAPAGAGVCGITGTGSGANTYNGASGRPNVFQGKLIAADTLQWTGIPIDPPGLNNSRTMRITNVRMNANQAPLSPSPLTTELLFYVTLTSPFGLIPFPTAAGSLEDLAGVAAGTQSVAFVQQEISVTTNPWLTPVTLPQCQSSNAFLLTSPASGTATSALQVNVSEGFQSAFKKKNLATTSSTTTPYPTGGDQNLNVAGLQYYTESGFENLGPSHDPTPNPPIGAGFGSVPAVAGTAAFPALNGLINAGVADQGMRIALRFDSVPSGVAIFVPVSLFGSALLISTDSSGAGPIVPVPSSGGTLSGSALAQISLTGGSGIAVYEILQASAFSAEVLNVPLVLGYVAGQPQAGVTATVTVLTAPFSGGGAADASSPIPRFGSGGVTAGTSVPLFAFETCGISAPQLTLTSSASTASPLDTITFTATVTPPPAAGALVTFYLDKAILAVVPLGASGIAQISKTIPACALCYPPDGNRYHEIGATYTTPQPGSLTLSATTSVNVPAAVILTRDESTNSQTVNVGQAFARLFLTATNLLKQPVANAAVTFTKQYGPGNFSNGSNTITIKTNASGVAAATFTAGSTPGNVSITATAPGSNTASFNLTSAAGPPVSMTPNAGTSPQSVPVYTAFYPPAVTLKDSLGNPVYGTSVQFSAPSSGPGGSVTSSRAVSGFDGVAALGGTNLLSAFNANSIAGGPYTVTATAAGVSAVNFLLTNTPSGAPLVITQPSLRSVFSNGSATFTAVAIGQPAPTVRWQVSNAGGAFTDIPNATAATLTIAAVSVAKGGNQYRAVFTNSLGYANSNPAQLYVLPIVTWNNPADIVSGTALGASHLNATADVPGVFAYDPPAGTVLGLGTAQMLSVNFTPYDIATYLPTVKTVAINVVATVPAPTIVSVTPAASSGASQAFTLQFSHTNGYANLNVLNILINTALDGRQGCYLAYVHPTNTLYLVNDAGDPSAPFAGGMVLNSSGSITNSQCTILGSGSSAVGNGNQLTLTLNMTFGSTFSGNKVIYLAARDLASNNTGWQTMGVHGVPSTTAPTGPNPVSMSPSSGTGASQTLTFTYQDATSATNLQTAWALINTALDGRASCYVAYYRPGNLLLLIPDNGDGTQATSMALSGSTNTLSNSQCTISAQGSSASTSGAQLTLNLNVTFKSAFTGPKGVWLAVQTLAAQTSPWQALGVWRVP